MPDPSGWWAFNGLGPRDRGWDARIVRDITKAKMRRWDA